MTLDLHHERGQFSLITDLEEVLEVRLLGMSLYCSADPALQAAETVRKKELFVAAAGGVRSQVQGVIFTSVDNPSFNLNSGLDGLMLKELVTLSFVQHSLWKLD